MLRLIPRVRQTAAFVAPPSSAATTAAIFSASIATGRPRRRAAARLALTRSCVNERSNRPSAPKTWKTRTRDSLRPWPAAFLVRPLMLQ